MSAAEVALVPAGVVTVTSTAPADPAGATALIEVAEVAEYVVAAVAPKLTALAPVKLVPVMTTVVPPANGPAMGLKAVTVGASS